MKYVEVIWIQIVWVHLYANFFQQLILQYVMASLTRWTWVWVNSGSWWWTGRPGVLWFMGLKGVGHDWATELNWTEHYLRLNEGIWDLGFRGITSIFGGSSVKYTQILDLTSKLFKGQLYMYTYNHLIIYWFNQWVSIKYLLSTICSFYAKYKIKQCIHVKVYHYICISICL